MSKRSKKKLRHVDPNYDHATAYRHMYYLCDLCGAKISTYSFGDMPIPFVVHCQEEGCQGRMTHVEWPLDRYERHHVPAVGDYYFSKTTAEALRRTALTIVERSKGSRYEIPENEVAQFVSDYIADYEGVGELCLKT